MILRKQLPVAWMPILNGTPPADAPLPEVTQELEEMAANHAGGADALIPPAPVLSRFASPPRPLRALWHPGATSRQPDATRRNRGAGGAVTGGH